MTNNINGLTNSHATAVGDSSRLASSQSSGGEAQKAADARPSQDTVNLTETGKQLSKLESQLQSVPVVDTQRVDNVKHAVNDGSYEINPAQVAHKLLQFEAYLPK